MGRAATCHIFGALALIAGGCNSTEYGLTPPPDRTVTQAYSLSPAEQQAVKDAVLKRASNPRSATFGPMNAGRFPNGQIMVCGTMAGTANGTPHPFATISVGGDQFFVMQMVISSTYGVCQDRGVPILKS